jgi:hypothetical protein
MHPKWSGIMESRDTYPRRRVDLGAGAPYLQPVLSRGSQRTYPGPPATLGRNAGLKPETLRPILRAEPA